MAKTNLSGAAYVEHGYGQVEPNHFAFQHTGQIYAQLPAAKAIDLLQNGQYVKYDYASNEVNLTGAGEWMLVFNEVKLYRDRQQYDDYAMTKEDFTNGVMTPRVAKTNVGDIYTTNLVDDAVLAVGDILTVTAATGFLKINANPTGMQWQVVKVYTLADNQKAVKLMRIV